MTGLERLKEIAKSTNDFIISRCIALEIEIAGICDQIEREHLREVDDISGRDADAIAWVESHGGIKECDRKVEASMEVGDKYTLLRMELGKLLGYDLMGQLDASDEELVEKVGKRLMPDGMEWPKVDGKPVDFKTAYGPSLGVLEAVSIYNTGACQVMSHDGIIKSAKDIHIVKPKVLDADGVEILVGDEVWDIYSGERMTAEGFTGTDGGYHTCRVTLESGEQTTCDGPRLTHRAPAIAADGKPLRVGETVFTVNLGIEGVVERIERQESDTIVHVRFIGDNDCAMREPSDITHERDSWERLEDDADALLKAESNGKGSYNAANDYCNAHGLGTDGTVWVLMARDLVRRAKKLAERGA